MAEPEPAIEVEVVAIDGQAPPPRAVESDQNDPRQARWQQWQGSIQGRLRTLDARWWPLWLILGIIAFAVILTVGVVLIILILVAKVMRGIFLALLAPLLSRSGNTSIR